MSNLILPSLSVVFSAILESFLATTFPFQIISSEANKKGVLLPYVNFEDRCTSCGVCEVICPDQAITVDVNKNWWVGKEDNSFNPKFSNGKK